MKKLLLILCTLLAAPVLRAQQPEKNILGVRAGAEIAYIRAWGEYVHGTTEPRIGFRFAVTDQVLLWQQIPLYVETGVHFVSRGGRHAGTSFRPMYLQIPVMLTYRFRLGRQFRIRPFAGAAYGIGIGGMARTAEDWIDLFGDSGFLRRSDLYMLAGVEASFRRVCLRVGIDVGCRNLLPGEIPTPLLPSGLSQLHSRSISIALGYDF